MMYLEASDHACPHLREQRQTETRLATVALPPQAGCPFGAGRAPAEPPRLAPTVARAMGWWAFAAEARSLGATA